MNYRQCFTTVFTDYLKEHGFHKKGSLFYRMNGDILQGVSVHAGLAVKAVTVGFYPYWIFPLNPGHGDPDLKKGHWTDEWRVGDVTSVKLAGDSGIDIVTIKNISAPDDMIEHMLKIKQGFAEVCMPLLDRVNDLDSFLHETVYFDPSKVPGFEQTRISYAGWDLQRPLLLKAYRDGSFDYAIGIAKYREEKYRQLQLRIYEQDIKRAVRRLKNADLMASWKERPKDSPDAFADFMNQVRSTAQSDELNLIESKIEAKVAEMKLSLLYEKYEAGDLNWIRGEYEALDAKAKEMLLTELKLRVDCPLE